jgi:hypothetical protein
MTYERVTVVLTEHEMEKLRKVAQRELRRPRDQAAFLLRRALLGETVEEKSKSAVSAFQGETGAFAEITQ